uniref:Uncharacterized protein n=1 Tax=Rhizophora mucronata TaxID=61149 RepID=A0A2P2R339_RHIMU
MRILKDHFVRK